MSWTVNSVQNLLKVLIPGIENLYQLYQFVSINKHNVNINVLSASPFHMYIYTHIQIVFFISKYK